MEFGFCSRWTRIAQKYVYKWVVPWYPLGDMVSFSGTMVPLNDTMVVPHYYHGTFTLPW